MKFRKTNTTILLGKSGENDKSIVMKSADKLCAVVVWDRDDCIKEAEKQLGNIKIFMRGSVIFRNSYKHHT